MQNRIGFIDALRGFTMLLVVFGHVISISLGRIELPFAQFFLTFRMPLFFFISGFIGYKAIEHWNIEFYWTRLRKKAFVQIVPATIFVLVSFAWFNTDIYKFFFVHSLEGFWFTYCLLEMFAIYYTLSMLAYALKLKSCLPAMVLLSLMGGGVFSNW